MHVINVVEPTQVNIVIARLVALSVVRGHFMRKFPKNRQGSGNPGNKAQ